MEREKENKVSKCDDNNCSVYILTFPDGKKYVGMTSRSVEDRWENGTGYNCNKRMYAAIKAVGWCNVKKEVCATGLSLLDAQLLEKQKIAEYRATEPDRGYNRYACASTGKPPLYPTLDVEDAELVGMFGMDGRFLRDFEDVDDAVANCDGATVDGIMDCIEGKTGSHAGKKWMIHTVNRITPASLALLMKRKQRSDTGGRHKAPKHGDTKIMMYDLKMRLEQVFDSLVDAAENNKVGATYQGIYACCKKAIRKHANKVWRWDKDASSDTLSDCI